MIEQSTRARWWREPLVHFLILGVLLFVIFHWRGSAAGTNRIVITPGQVDALVAAFTRTWQRPPTEQELKGQIDEYVREEIATREAMTIGLDRDDTIIRRRLRQKLEFLAEDTLDTAPPTEADLQQWLDAHGDRFGAEPVVAFRQVHLSPERRGRLLDADVQSLRDELADAAADVSIEGRSDSVMLAQEVSGATRADVARMFGEQFADAIVTADLRRWSGPVRSSYGAHVVFVRSREAARTPLLHEVRAQVEREWTVDRRQRRLESMYAGLLARYRVVIEPRGRK
jgi:hypothetical protein